MKDGNTIYWRYYYGRMYDEYYFSTSSNGTKYVYYREYANDWVKDPMSDSSYSDYVEMIADSYGIDEYAKTLLEYVANNFDTITTEIDDSYIVATTIFGVVNNLTLRNDQTTLFVTFNMYSDYYNIEFFAINKTTINIPTSALNAPSGDVFLP